MLKNYINQDETINRIHYPKNNFFCYRWRVKDHFSKAVDRRQYHMAVLGAGQDQTLMNNKILNLYKARYHASNSELIVDLAQKTMQFLDERRAKQKEISQQEVLLSTHLTSLLHRCYNTLFAFATELNALMGLSELFITGTDPVTTNKVNGRPTVNSKILSRLSTQSYSLFIEGFKDKIKFYILPAEELLALGDLATHQHLVVCLRAKVNPTDHAVDWFFDDEPLCDSQIEMLCVELLNALLEETKERLVPTITEQEKSSESFSLFDPEPWYMETMHRHHAQKTDKGELEQREQELEQLAEQLGKEANGEFEYDEVNRRWTFRSSTSSHTGSKPKSVESSSIIYSDAAYHQAAMSPAQPTPSTESVTFPEVPSQRPFPDPAFHGPSTIDESSVSHSVSLSTPVGDATEFQTATASTRASEGVAQEKSGKKLTRAQRRRERKRNKKGKR